MGGRGSGRTVKQDQDHHFIMQHLDILFYLSRRGCLRIILHRIERRRYPEGI